MERGDDASEEQADKSTDPARGEYNMPTYTQMLSMGTAVRRTSSGDEEECQHQRMRTCLRPSAVASLVASTSALELSACARKRLARPSASSPRASRIAPSHAASSAINGRSRAGVPDPTVSAATRAPSRLPFAPCGFRQSTSSSSAFWTSISAPCKSPNSSAAAAAERSCDRAYANAAYDLQGGVRGEFSSGLRGHATRSLLRRVPRCAFNLAG